MMKRTTFYSITLTCAFLNCVFSLYAGSVDGFSRYLHIFGKMAGIISVLTWVWVSVLLSYNNRPTSTHKLTKASVHFYFFASLVPLFIALGIMVLTQVPEECATGRYSDGESGGWCGNSATSGVLCILTSVFAGLSALAIRRGVNGDLSLNVCHHDGDKPDSTELPFNSSGKT